MVLRKPGKEETLEARNDGLKLGSKVKPVKVKLQGPLMLEAKSGWEWMNKYIVIWHVVSKKTIEWEEGNPINLLT